jgi:hypothetical protein
MASRRSLVEGLIETPVVDPALEKKYVYSKPASTAAAPAPAKPVKGPAAVGRTPISTRLRTDLAEALKRASLQRQLEKIEPSSLTEILEAAIEPWLKEHGYLD